MHNVPDTVEILRTVRDFLADEVLPAVEDTLAYRTRVAVNLLEILGREHTIGPVHEAREREMLGSVLGMDGDVGLLNAELCRRLDSAETDAAIERPALEALLAIAADKLEIARPGYGTAR
jgi:hypothetical protein